MKPLTHFLASLVLAAVFYPFFGWSTLAIFAGGVLIDIDHYIYYALKYKKMNIAVCYKFYAYDAAKEDFKDVTGSLMAFHTAEFAALCVLLSFYSTLALMFTAGLLLHYFLDLIFLYLVPKKFIANHSIVWWLIKNFQKV